MAQCPLEVWVRFQVLIRINIIQEEKEMIYTHGKSFTLFTKNSSFMQPKLLKSGVMVIEPDCHPGSPGSNLCLGKEKKISQLHQ